MLPVAVALALSGAACLLAALRPTPARARLTLLGVACGAGSVLVAVWPATLAWVAATLLVALTAAWLGEGRVVHEVRARASALSDDVHRLDDEVVRRDAAGRERVSDLAEVAPVGFYETDGQGRWIWASERLGELVDRGVDELLGDGWQQLVASEQRAPVAARWARAARAGASWSSEQPLAGGAERWVHFESMPRRAGDGEAGHVGTLVDVTERRRREALGQQLDQRLQSMQRSESLGDLVGGVAHDVNNLLVGILGGADLALQRQGDGAYPTDPDAPRLEDLLDTIRSAANRGAELARQLLTYTGHEDAAHRPVELTALVDEMIALLGTSVLREIQVQHVKADGPVTVMGSPSSLCQIVANLLTNAAQATGPGGRVRVTTSVGDVAADELAGDVTGAGRAPGIYGRVAVDDDGPGIADGQVERIFEAFYTTRDGGRGLGLAVVQGAVRSHAGCLLVDRSPEGGARLAVLIPATTQGEPAGPVLEPGPRVDLSGSVLLVVDDEPSVRRVVASMLGSCGAEVLVAADAAEATALVEAHGPRLDLVLLDIALPGCDGPTLLGDLRVLRPDLQAALISGYPETEGLERSGGNAVSGYLQKPFTADTLVLFVSRMLGREEVATVR